LCCSKHHAQLYRNGYIHVTSYDPNRMIVYKCHVEIELRDRKGRFLGSAKVSLDKYSMVKNYKWRKSSNGYVSSHIVGDIHRFITGCSDGFVVDHMDGDKLNNVNDNLRVCKHSENCRNSKISKNNTSGFTGVYLSKSSGRWFCSIMVNRKSIYPKCDGTFEGAVEVRKEAEIKYFGEFRNSNR